jgi:uncharacterized protein (UPF0332 family)
LKKLLKKIRVDKKWIEKELKESQKDLVDAKDSFQNGKFKWSIIQAYYSIFHSARAVLFSYGFKGKKPFCACSIP